MFWISVNIPYYRLCIKRNNVGTTAKFGIKILVLSDSGRWVVVGVGLYDQSRSSAVASIATIAVCVLGQKSHLPIIELCKIIKVSY